MLKFMRTAIFYLAVIIYFIFGSLISWVISLFHKDKSLVFRKTSKMWSNFLLFVGGINVEVSGLENIPKNQAIIFVSNHQSAMDIPILTSALPLFRFTPKKELFKIPFFGWYLRKADYLLIDRGSAAHKTISEANQILKRGEYLHIFPEGTRSEDGSLGVFKRGSLFLAFHTKTPLVPVAISGSFKILPRGTRIINPAEVKVTISKPIFIEKGNYDEALKELKDSISKLLR